MEILETQKFQKSKDNETMYVCRQVCMHACIKSNMHDAMHVFLCIYVDNIDESMYICKYVSAWGMVVVGGLLHLHINSCLRVVVVGVSTLSPSPCKLTFGDSGGWGYVCIYIYII